jgi:hypothetical protein
MYRTYPESATTVNGQTTLLGVLAYCAETLRTIRIDCCRTLFVSVSQRWSLTRRRVVIIIDNIQILDMKSNIVISTTMSPRLFAILCFLFLVIENQLRFLPLLTRQLAVLMNIKAEASKRSQQMAVKKPC